MVPVVDPNAGSDGGYRGFDAHGNQTDTFATALRAAGYRTAMMGKYLNGYRPRGPAFNEADMSDKPAWIKGRPPLTEQQINKIDTSFRKRAQAVQAVDKMLGDIQATLRASGVDRDTYIVFSSDNGFHMGQRRLTAGKMTAYDSDIRVPLVVTGPGVEAGRTTNALAQNTDLRPTFDQLAGTKTPDTVDGRSLVPFLDDGTAERRDAVLIEHHGPDHQAGDPDLPTRASGNPPGYEAVRTAHELYVEYADGEREYYELRHDPYELDNAVTRLPAARLSELTSMLHRLATCSGRECR